MDRVLSRIDQSVPWRLCARNRWHRNDHVIGLLWIRGSGPFWKQLGNVHRERGVVAKGEKATEDNGFFGRICVTDFKRIRLGKHHESYFGTDLVILNHGQMTRTTPELAPFSPNFHATPTGGRLATTYDLTCNRPHTRRIFSGIGSRTWNPPAPKPRPYH
ncbi:hypothetical protein AVEN_90135-1 [Araneus ventricosus]|uniref:Uncharacterized protein n=1 Tax=Araneus ventricosus TaxID=182803 RepID=A0A4Y2R6L9_ARAVE|nr:hypothetical protein AVEN_150153-1 [Araneus ventricosus]GBN71417.1 hypothetical protein AVEN_66912-1 [Araneus ventricosus]GBN78133.1 hypothetical protein AVEN_24983-1 [Araneus ventricosus]GBN78142.1 hypothetical protein AVEN_90135-1 [Araneus ventricosus]